MIRLATIIASQAVLVIGALLAAGIAYLFENFLGFSAPLQLSPAAAAGFAALIPGLWLTHFYSQNRREDAPLRLVGRTLVLGALVAGPLAWLLVSLTAADRSLVGAVLSPLAAAELVHQVLVVSLGYETIKYLVLVHSVGDTEHLNDTHAGLMYSMSIGMGFAAYLGASILIAAGTASLAGAATALGTLVCIEVAGVGVTGYTLGYCRARQVRGGRRVLISTVAVVVAAIISAGVRTAASVANSRADDLQSWPSLLVAAVGTTLVFAVLSTASRRSTHHE